MRRSAGGTRKKAKSRGRVSGVKRKSTRRRRIGASGDIGGMVEQAGGIVLGAIAGREVAVLIGGMIPSLQANALIVGLAQVAGGVMLGRMGKGAFMTNLGYGLIANGGVTAVVATGIISGPGNTMAYKINGTSNLPVLSGTSNLPVVSGTGTRISNNNAPGIGATTRIANNTPRTFVKNNRYSPML